MGAGDPLVKLVREYKGPTVEDLLEHGDSEFDHLPGRIHGVLEAIEKGDLAGADRRLEESLGTLLEGPGSDQRREFAVLMPLVFSMFLILVAATIVMIW